MNFKKIQSAAAALIFVSCLVSCTEKNSSDSSDTAVTTSSETEDDFQPIEITSEELVPPSPADSPDSNAVTFDDDDFSFAYIQDQDSDSAKGTLVIAEVQGNKMLKFDDDFSVPTKGKVQKIIINAAALLGTDNLSKVRSIEFDMYADAETDAYINEDGENVKVPGTISGGGGTVTSRTDSEGKGRWYDFDEFEGGEYNFDMSGAVHAEFKFLLSASGLCWSSEMEDANFLIMRWGSENDSNLYIDNIVFYDENGESIPLIDRSTVPTEETT